MNYLNNEIDALKKSRKLYLLPDLINDIDLDISTLKQMRQIFNLLYRQFNFKYIIKLHKKISKEFKRDNVIKQKYFLSLYYLGYYPDIKSNYSLSTVSEKYSIYMILRDKKDELCFQYSYFFERYAYMVECYNAFFKKNKNTQLNFADNYSWEDIKSNLFTKFSVLGLFQNK